MKKFILVAIMLLTFCGAVAYGDACDFAKDKVQSINRQMHACIAKCSGWGPLQGICVAACGSWYTGRLISATTGCQIECEAEHKSTEGCCVWDIPGAMESPSSLNPAGKAAYDKLMRDVREKVQAAVAEQEAAAKNKENK